LVAEERSPRFLITESPANSNRKHVLAMSNLNHIPSIANALPAVVEPQYHYYRATWKKLRDCIAGELEIKNARETYLRRMPGMSDEEYAAYLERATYYNMTAATQKALTGQAFHRNPSITNLPSKFKDAVNVAFTRDGGGHIAFAKEVVTEVLAVGRCAVLVDASALPSSVPAPYVTLYTAENILDWTIETIDGVNKLTRVLLREFVRDAIPQGSTQNPWIGKPIDSINARRKAQADLAGRPTRNTGAYTYRNVWRELLLEARDDGSYVYVQNIYDDTDPSGIPTETFTPRVRGEVLGSIPFVFFGPSGNKSDCDRPPLADIADLNISHFRNSAEYEYGLKYCALPQYYSPLRDQDGSATYSIGPSVVWECPEGSTPGILEFSGQGLGAILTALKNKEASIIALGGRLTGAQVRGSESDGQAAVREANEASLLESVISATENGMAMVIRFWLLWRDVPLSATEGLTYQINLATTAAADARLLRSLQSLYERGAVGIDVIHNAVVEAGYLDPETTLEEFKASLADPANFPNQPDVAARQRGFADRQQELKQAAIAPDATQ
jgi:Domain of unknown function (DUF4055)